MSLKAKIISIVLGTLLIIAIAVILKLTLFNKTPSYTPGETSVKTVTTTISANTTNLTTTTTVTTSTVTAKQFVTSTETSTTKSATTKKTSEVQAQTATYYEFPVDVNTVSLEHLMAINGIGELTAQSIINYRNSIGIIYNMDLLLEVDGVGTTTLELLKQYLYVSDYDYADIVYDDPDQSTSTAVTTTTVTETTTETSTTAEKVMKPVNINTASAEEMAECLLIDLELAEKIVELRGKINKFSNFLELLYVDGFSQKMLAERQEYILL